MVSTREDPTPAGVVSHPSRAAPRVLALLLTACLLLPLGLPALSGSSVPVLSGEGDGDDSSGSPSSDWPPPAWHQGDMSELSLVELALLASDSRPSPENRAELERGLAPLEDMPPEHTELTRVVLEGLAQARWHQVQAMRHLNEEQRAIVAQADPDAPLPEGWGDVMGAVDHQELAKALLALEASSARALAIFESLHGAPPAPGVAETLADATGTPLPETLPVLPVEAPSADLTTALVAQVTNLALEPAELAYLKESLNGMPPEARSAVHLILEGLVPFAAGAPADPGAALVELGGAVDAARDTLELWSTAAMAQQLFHVATSPGIQVPDADTDRPPLHFGVPRLRDPGAPLPPAPSLPEALRELALAFGDHETARDAEEKAHPVMEVLPQSQQDAVAQMLAQAARYIRAQEAAGEVSVPGALVQNPSLLTAWVGYLDEGLPEPGSLEARDLLAARGYLQAQLEAVLSREDLKTAIQDAVEELTPEAQPSSSSSSPLPDAPTLPAPMMPMSGPLQEAGIDCPLDEEVIGVAPYFLIEPCGEDTVWTQEDLSVFVIDMGGNDTYTGPFAGAPFVLNTVGPVDILSPISVLLDLGGSDTYDASGHDCALGAACGERVHGDVNVEVPVIGVLVDWQGDGAQANNTFVSGHRSQGHGTLGTGLLVERAGRNSVLGSTYEGGNFSQGTAISPLSEDVVNGVCRIVTTSMVCSDTGLEVGALLRLVGSGSHAEGDFIARERSQASQAGIGGVAALLNIAGHDAYAPDRYKAGNFSQGATQLALSDLEIRSNQTGLALFVDVVGSGGQSDDVYIAHNRARAYGEGAYFFDLLLPERVEDEGLVEVDDRVDLEDGAGPAVRLDARSTGPRSSSNDTYVLHAADDPEGTPAGHGYVESAFNLPVEGQTVLLRVDEDFPHVVGPFPIWRDSWNFMKCEGEPWALSPTVQQVVNETRNDIPGHEQLCLSDIDLGEINTPSADDGVFVGTLFLDLGGDDVYPEHEVSFAGNNQEWNPNGRNATIATGVDTNALDDWDGDFMPYFLEVLLLDEEDADQDSDDPQPTGRRVVVDLGARYGSFDGGHAFVLSLMGNTVYGEGFSSAVLLDLGGDNEHLGRTAAATGAAAMGEGYAASQNLLSFTLDLDGEDVYRSTADGSMGFGAVGAVGILFDLGGNDHYHGNAYTQGVGVDGGLGVLVDLKSRSLDGGEEINRFRADGAPAQGAGVAESFGLAGVGILAADGDHNEFHDGEPLPTPRELPAVLEDMDAPLPDEVAEVLEDLEGDFQEAWENVPEIVRSEVEDVLEDAGGELEDNLEAVLDQVFDALEEDWPEEDTGIRQQGTGVSVNQGGGTGPVEGQENRAPVITHWGVKELGWWTKANETVDAADLPLLQVNQAYTFNATAKDEDDDRIEFCWEAQDHPRRCEWPEGRGVVEGEMEFNWRVVPTQGRLGETVRDFNVRLDVRDAGGKGDSTGLLSIPVRNDPPQLMETNLRAPGALGVGEWAVFQVPFLTQGREDLPFDPGDDMVEVDWGDGTSGRFNATAVDWAQAQWGGRIQLQAEADVGFDSPPEILAGGSLRHAIGDPERYFGVLTGAGDHQLFAPATFVIDFDGPRQIRQVALNASLLQEGDPQVRFGVEGVRTDGTTFPVGSGAVRFTSIDWERYQWDLTDFPDMRGLVIRQLIDEDEHRRLVDDEGSMYRFRVAEISATGPGAIKDGWLRPGAYEVDYTVLDRFGGRNSTMDTVQVLGAMGEEEGDEPTLRLVDLGGRGAVQHTSLARGDEYTVELVIDNHEELHAGDRFCVGLDGDTDPEGLFCMDGDNTEAILEHSWSSNEPVPVVACYMPLGASECNADETWVLTTVYAEDALDLRLPAEFSIPGQQFLPDGVQTAGRPILFVTFDPDRTTWHEGLQHQAIVDAGGDDRYVGQFAASVARSTADILPGVPVPHLLVDAGGDDIYVSNESRTQAFATHFGVALLMDAGGNDTYVAAGHAQAAATRGGVAALVSLGGRDMFNPVPADHPVALNVSAHEPTPLDSFRGQWRPIGTGPDLVQGAAEDGVALFVTAGGPGLFHAGNRAQGYGSHIVPSVDYYAFPGAGEDCEIVSPGPSVDPNDVLCRLLGLNNARINDPGYYLNDPEQDEGFWCRSANPLGRQACEGAGPDSSPLSAFLTSGPRYSPGLGAAVRLDGAAFYHAGAQGQGSAGPDGRGLLWDLDGASALLAGDRSQAFSESGLAGTVLGGAGVLRLGQDGQAHYRDAELESGLPLVPEGPEAGLTLAMRAAVLMTLGSRDDRCGQGCGPDGGIAIDSREGDSLDAPGVDVVLPDGPVEGVDDEVVVDVVLEEGAFEVAAFAVALEYDEDGECLGRPLAAPALVHEGTETGGFSFALDVGRLVAGTDPLLPAGCTEVHVFARSVEEVKGAWGHGSDDVLLLPPPRVPVSEEDPHVTFGTGIEFSVRVPEPLAGLNQPPAEFRVVGGGPNGQDQVLSTEIEGGASWDEDRLRATFDPDNVAEGVYEVQLRVQWPGQDGLGAWVGDVARVEVVHLDVQEVFIDEAFTNPHPVGTGPFVLSGSATGFMGLMFRLLDDDEEVEEALRDGGCDPIGSPAVVEALLAGDPRDVQRWSAELCLPAAVMQDDTFQVQFSAGGDEWEFLEDAVGDRQKVLFAGDPPRLERVVTPGGFQGTSVTGVVNDTVNDRVEMCVEVSHNGVGVDPVDVQVSVIAWDEEKNVNRFDVTRAEDLDPAPGGLQGARCAPVEGNRVVYGYAWQSPDGEILEEGMYHVHVLARDRVGGLFDSNPEVRFPVDRVDPVLDHARAVLPMMMRPDGEAVPQQAVRPGDEVRVLVRVIDDNLDRVEVVIPLEDSGEHRVPLQALEVDGPQNHAGWVQVPANPALDAQGRMRIDLDAVDRAGNTAMVEVPWEDDAGGKRIPFHSGPFGIEDLTVVERSESVHLDWVVDRCLDAPGDGMRLVVQDADGNKMRAMGVDGANCHHRVDVRDLDSDTSYRILLEMWDAANHTLEELRTVHTLELPQGTHIGILTNDQPTYAGTGVEIEGRLLAGEATISGSVSLHLDDPGSDPVAGIDEIRVEQGQREEFILVWDSTMHVPPGDGAQDVTLHMAFTDGSLTWRDNVTLRIDNTPPGLELDVFGPAPNQGWYNGTIVVGVEVTDDTPPFGHLVEVEQEGTTEGPLQWKTVTLDKDGVHHLAFTVSDGAVPPNVAHLEATLKVDRTLPSLNVTRGLPEHWTNETFVPFDVEASDTVSGLDGHRVRAGTLGWSAWTQVPPTGVSLEDLPDGEHWIDVQVRDKAHNVREESFSVILDRTPPELVDARWVGWTQETEPRPVVHIVARDRLDGDGRPSGMDAVRFAPAEAGPWTNWTRIGTSGTFAINETGSGVVWVQLRDRATNVAEPVRVDTPLPERHIPDPDAHSTDAPASALLREVSFSPEHGSPETPFVFSVRVHPLADALPDRVVLTVADRSHDMEPEGPALEGGARFYTATVTLPPTDFQSPHAFTIGAVYGDRVVERSAQPGPLVANLGAESVAPQQEEDARGFPIPAVPVLLLVFVLVTLFAFKRRTLRPLIIPWRRKP